MAVMGMDIEFGNWMMPLIISGAAFFFAALSVSGRAGWLWSGVLFGMAGIASVSIWAAWAKVVL